jgi:hypothetical protein
MSGPKFKPHYCKKKFKKEKAAMVLSLLAEE